MCGIAGILTTTSKEAYRKLLVEMCDEVKHRGPDGEGFLFPIGNSEPGMETSLKGRPNLHLAEDDVPVYFGHRRLSILDLSSSAAQPMKSTSGRSWIIFNGEIYNHRELRKELESLGHRFHTDHSDTEVILASYEEWGYECLARFRGMFAFALYDKKERSTWLVRDRMGIKPLYYYYNNRELFFGSEIKSILRNNAVRRKINQTALYDYLTFMCVASPDTMFEGIKKLAPAHYMVYKDGSLSEPVQYWDPLEERYALPDDEKKLCDLLLQTYTEAVNYRRESDVPYGILLSGGVDSTANLAVLSSLINKPVEAFSVGFDPAAGYQNEFEYSRKAAKLYKANYHELKLDESHFAEFLPKMVFHQDEPTADTASIPIYYISRHAKLNGVTVLMGGEGSDELFIGYELWRKANDFQKALSASEPVGAMVASAMMQIPFIKNKRPYWKNWLSRHRNKQQIFWGGTDLRSEEYKRRILSPAFLKEVGGYSSYESINRIGKRFREKGGGTHLDFMSYLDLSFRLPELLLSRLDKMTMAASVEGRVPFLDHKLVEFSFSIPSHLKIKNREEKYILKKSLEGTVPQEILYRRKVGFPVPLQQLFGGTLHPVASKKIRMLNDQYQLFTKEHVQELLTHKRDAELWTVLNLAMWNEAFIN